MENLTNYQYYKGLNNRFDNRVKKLLKAGLFYDKDLIGFRVKNRMQTNPNNYILNSVIMHSDKRHFNLILKNF
jgi:hypothetical protein